MGNRLTRSEPGRTERYGYDHASRLLSVERTGDSPESASFSYDPVGNRIRDEQQGRLRSLRYDARNRLLDAGPAASLRVSGTTSEPATVTIQGQPARMLPGQGFEGEVPAAAPPGDTELTVEARDPSGNLRTNTYRVPASSAGTAYGHDANGNLTSRVDASGSWTYESNGQNQLVRVTKDGQELARFAYDPLGRRVRKVAGGATYSYVYSGMDILQETIAAATTTTYRYIHGPGIDEPLARQNTATAALDYYHADGLGSIVRMTDTAANVTPSRQYDAWGNPESATEQAGFAFTGREWDPETGLYYFRARYLDPKIGRFISEDPIGFGGGINFFSYVGNNGPP